MKHTLRELEDISWEKTQMLFQYTHDHPFIGFLAMFDLIPYKQRFLAFTEMGDFNVGILDDLSATLIKAGQTLKTQSLLWVDETLATWNFHVGVS